MNESLPVDFICNETQDGKHTKVLNNHSIPFEVVDHPSQSFATHMTTPFQTNQTLSPEDIITKVGEDYNLQTQQWITFRIIARTFIQRYVKKINSDDAHLHMLLYGPTKVIPIVAARILACWGIVVPSIIDAICPWSSW